MEKLGDILRYSRPQRVLGAAAICSQAQEVVGNRATVVSCVAGVLKLRVHDQYQAFEINSQNIDLIERINKRLGKNLIERLRFDISS